MTYCKLIGYGNKSKKKLEKEKYTIGCLYIDDEFICNTIEDTDRGLSQDMSEEEIKSKKYTDKQLSLLVVIKFL